LLYSINTYHHQLPLLKKKKKQPANTVVVLDTYLSPPTPAVQEEKKQLVIKALVLDKDLSPEQKALNEKIQASQAVTQWVIIDTSADATKEDCPICLCELEEDVVMLSSFKGHSFHAACISQCSEGGFIKCPICSFLYGMRKGDQPTGTMTVTFHPVGTQTLSGYESCGTIQIVYDFPSGIQGKEHTSPGTPYAGTNRICYLPNNDKGNEVLALLKIAFDRKLTFTIGTSVTNGTPNCVIWNGIHHKTARSGGATNYGYPDETYFERVKSELKSLGVV